MSLRLLDLPECRVRIAKYLNFDGLKACALVSRSWYLDFQPLIWEIATTTFPEFKDPSYVNRVSWLSSFRSNARVIRHLRHLPWEESIDPELYDILLGQCRGLVTLEAGARNESEWASMMAFIKVNPMLRRVHLHIGSTFYNPKDNGRQILIALEGCTRLRDLALTCPVTELSALRYLEAHPSLESLTVARLECNNTLIPAHNAKPASKLARLEVDSCEIAAFVTLLDRCSSLQSLRLIHIPEDGRFGHFWGHLLDGRLQHLTTISLGTTHHIKEQDRRTLLKAVPPQQLRQIELRSVTSEELHLLVERHYQSIEALEFFAVGIPGEVLADLFTKCRRLRKLKASLSTAVDLRYLLAGAWKMAATLEELDMPIGIQLQCSERSLVSHSLAEKDQEAPGREEWLQAERVFMKRLSGCPRLKFLSLKGSPLGSNDDFKGLSWLLSTGLGHLSGQARLERLDITGQPSFQGLPELQFMKAHWPHLRILKCAEFASNEIHQWLRETWPELTVFIPRRSSLRSSLSFYNYA